MGRVALAWDPDLSVLLGCAALLAAYYASHRSDLSRARRFVVGVTLMALALISPLDTLGDEYLFSAHMLQHLMLELAAPPLLLVGIGPRFARAVVDCAPLGRIERVLGAPLVAWTLGIGTLAIWHAPALFDAALGNEYIHIVEHLCFLVSATIFWWPVLAPLPECRIAPLWAQLYLLGGAMANSLLGIWITFAPAGLYAPYLHPDDSRHLESLLRAGWGLTPALDQQIGGLLMWVGGGFVFLAVMISEFLRWYGGAEPDGAAAAGLWEDA